jgi:hypothetical protein
MKNLLTIILTVVFALAANETFSQKTELYLNFDELENSEKNYTLYFSVSIHRMSIFYKYDLRKEEINGIVSLDEWEKFPFENFRSNKIQIFYTIEGEHNCVEGEIRKKIKLGEKNFFKFKENFFGLKVKKCNNLDCE